MTTITQTTGLSIRRATQADRTTVAAIITAAFFDDPVCSWLLPDEAEGTPVNGPAATGALVG